MWRKKDLRERFHEYNLKILIVDILTNKTIYFLVVFQGCDVYFVQVSPFLRLFLRLSHNTIFVCNFQFNMNSWFSNYLMAPQKALHELPVNHGLHFGNPRPVGTVGNGWVAIDLLTWFSHLVGSVSSKRITSDLYTDQKLRNPWSAVFMN